MGFEKGVKKFRKGEGGRPKGARNRKTVVFQQALERHGYDHADTLIMMLKNAIRDYEYYVALRTEKRISPMEDNAHKNLKIAVDIVKEINSYSMPKLKSVEFIKHVDIERPLIDVSDKDLDEYKEEP